MSTPRQPSLPQARRWFAEELRTIGHLLDERVVDAFAAVPRERFAGRGPWRILHFADGYWTTPDADRSSMAASCIASITARRRPR